MLPEIGIAEFERAYCIFKKKQIPVIPPNLRASITTLIKLSFKGFRLYGIDHLKNWVYVHGPSKIIALLFVSLRLSWLLSYLKMRYQRIDNRTPFQSKAGKELSLFPSL